jgi:Phosphotransferase enzyme family/RNA ligase
VGEAVSEALLASPGTVLEKLDGLNVGLDFGPARRLRFWSRNLGEVRPRAFAPELWPLLDWAYGHLVELWSLLGTRRVLFGEWLGLPGALPYPRRPDDFVGLGIRAGSRFVEFAAARRQLVEHGLAVPPVLMRGVPRALAALSRRSRWGGAAEGVVLEHRGQWFKWVRPDFAAVRREVGKNLPPAGHRNFPTSNRPPVVKRFGPEHRADGELELSILRRSVGPRVVAVERSPRSLKLALEHVGSGRWPKRPRSAALVQSLGRGLKTLHALSGVDAPGLPASPAEHARPTSRKAALLLAAQERSLTSLPPVLCHGDLKPSNVRVSGEVAHLIDFDRALKAERAWELGCAADRLAIPRCLLPGLWKQAGVTGGDEVSRAALYRLAWVFAGAKADAAGGPTARRLAQAARARAERLRRFL